MSDIKDVWLYPNGKRTNIKNAEEWVIKNEINILENKVNVEMLDDLLPLMNKLKIELIMRGRE